MMSALQVSSRVRQLSTYTLVFAAALLMFEPSRTGAQQPERLALGRKIAELRRKHDVPSMVVAVVNSQGLVEAKCSGDRKRGSDDEVELSDRFAIGSNTKSMTATLAAVLVEQGKIDWSTTVGDVWPKATEEHIHPTLQSVTLDELLSHQSGLKGDLTGAAWSGFLKERRSPTLERRRMLKKALSDEPAGERGKYSYSNLGYAVASAMLETRAKEPFEALMKQYVFDPLEMASADFRTLASAKQQEPPMVWGHAADGSPVDPRVLGAENPTIYAGCGTVHLSIEDYAKYARWHLAGEPAPVLQSQAAFDHLHEPLVDSGPSMKYACGWILAPTQLGPGLNHGGSNTNSFALIWVVPSADFAAVAFTNTGEPQAFASLNELMVHLMSTHSVEPVEVDPTRLVGRYELNPTFIFDVKYENGRMMVGITNQATQEVFADSPTRWSYRTVKATLEFHIRAEGPAYALTLHQNGNAQEAKRIGD